jgi:hypothetical protein
MKRMSLVRVVPLLCALIVIMPKSIRAAASAPRIIKDIPHASAEKGDRRRSFDLYLPADTGKRPPLLAFIRGGFWLLSDATNTVQERARQEPFELVNKARSEQG